MVHSRLEQTVSMKSAPKPHRRKPRSVRQSFDRKIDFGFLRHQIDISKNRDPGGEVFENLSAPACLCPREVTFPLLKPELEEEGHQVRKKSAGGSKGMMIVITPAEAQRILPTLLELACPIARFPVEALLRKEKVAGDVGTGEIDCLFLELQRMGQPLGVINEISFPRS